MPQLNEDLTPFQRRYTKFIRRCDELERMLRHFEDAIEHTDLEIPVRFLFDLFMRSTEMEILWCRRHPWMNLQVGWRISDRVAFSGQGEACLKCGR